MTTTINNRKKWNKYNITIDLPIFEQEDINEIAINEQLTHKSISRWRLKTHKFINKNTYTNIDKHTKKYSKTL
jgi:hypothetical protein